MTSETNTKPPARHDLKRENVEKPACSSVKGNDEYRFNIALSFAGEYRGIVSKVADGLAGIFGKNKILYDSFHQSEFARPNLDLHLQNLYHNESKLIVVFLGKYYNEKSWCGLEWRAIRDLLNQQTNDDRIMFVRCDNGEVNGVYGRVDGYKEISDETIDEAIDLIVERYSILCDTPNSVKNINPTPKTNTKPPAFRDLKQETKEKPASSSSFLDLRFASCPIEYVRLDEVWQAFEGFYTSPEPFSWWLIAGGAGTGKSRTAFKFCEFLENEKQWDAGFVSLEPPPQETWHTWHPEQDTLLVIDYVAREFSGDSRNIARIFTPLTRRAKNKELGDKRIRILLLEREYKERNEAGQPLEWYRQLDKTTRYQPPFDLGTVSDKGLYEIAEQAAKDIWESPNPLPARPDFLDKLTKLDEHKRPLFAMLLAGYLGINPKAGITPNGVLDFAIEQEFERFLTPAGVEKDPALLHALIQATCTSGNVGACRPPSDHSLWDSGLGDHLENDDEDFFLFHPIEPDLLGERFVLSRGGGVRSRQINKKTLKALLQTCWQEAPFETADFFNRCAQDFASSDSEVIVDLFVSAIPTVKGDFLSQELWLAISVNLAAFLNPVAGRRVWEDMTELGKTPEFALLRAKAAFNLISGYCNAENLSETLPEARKLFDLMDALGKTPEFALCRTKAAVNLIGGYCKAENLSETLPEAHKLFDLMDALGKTPEFALCRAKAAVNLICGYCNAENLSEARKLFDLMTELDETPEITFSRAIAAFNLISYYLAARQDDDAKNLFGELLEDETLRPVFLGLLKR